MQNDTQSLILFFFFLNIVIQSNFMFYWEIKKTTTNLKGPSAGSWSNVISAEESSGEYSSLIETDCRWLQGAAMLLKPLWHSNIPPSKKWIVAALEEIRLVIYNLDHMSANLYFCLNTCYSWLYLGFLHICFFLIQTAIKYLIFFITNHC